MKSCQGCCFPTPGSFQIQGNGQTPAPHPRQCPGYQPLDPFRSRGTTATCDEARHGHQSYQPLDPFRSRGTRKAQRKITARRKLPTPGSFQIQGNTPIEIGDEQGYEVTNPWILSDPGEHEDAKVEMVTEILLPTPGSFQIQGNIGPRHARLQTGHVTNPWILSDPGEPTQVETLDGS